MIFKILFLSRMKRMTTESTPTTESLQSLIRVYEERLRKLEEQLSASSSVNHPDQFKHLPVIDPSSYPLPSLPSYPSSFSSSSSSSSSSFSTDGRDNKRNYLTRGQIVDCLLRCGYLEETLNTLTNYKSALDYELGMLKYDGPMNFFVIQKHFDRLRMGGMTRDEVEVRERILKLAEKRREEFEQRKEKGSWVKSGSVDLLVRIVCFIIFVFE
jgi:hypothetical protein